MSNFGKSWSGPALALATLLLCIGCSSTTLSGSWKSPEYTGKVKKVYIVGVSKQETRRRMFEDQFTQQLGKYGVVGISSYHDFPTAQNADIGAVTGNVKANGADSVLLTRVLSKRTEEVVNPGRISTYNVSPSYYGRGESYRPQPYYRNYNSYYDRRYEMTYEPATITQFVVVTLESNLYDTASGELIWSAQLETLVEGTIDSLVKDYIKTVTTDLHDQGLI